MKRVYTHHFRLNGKNYMFPSSYKNRFLAKLEFLLCYVFGEPWEVLEEDYLKNVSQA